MSSDLNLLDNSNINLIKGLISMFSSDLNKQKNFINHLNELISPISLSNKEYFNELQNLNIILPILISELQIPFCDLINENKNIINYYVNNFLQTKSELIKKILINYINVFNFVSEDKTPSDNLILSLQDYDNEIKEMLNNKRNNKTEIEEIYDNLYSLYNKSTKEGFNEKIDEYKLFIQEKTNTINEFEEKKKYSNATIEFLREKINKIEKLLNTGSNQKIISINPNLNNFNYLNANINKSMNNPNLFFPVFFNNFNRNNNIINNLNYNGLSMEEQNKLKEIPLKDRTFFYLNEELNEGEDEYIEFKNYTYPFNQEKIDEIKRQYCGFLNNHGGRMYFGIDDNKIVKGIHLNYKNRDTIRNELINYTYDFYPKCRIDKINVYFIQIKNPQNKKIINNLYVIQIIILPGEPYNLYSITNKGGFISTLRLPGQCINLTAEEIHSEIMRRGDLLKEKYSQKHKNEINEIENEMEGKNIEDINYEDNNNENDNEDSTQSNNEKIEKVEESDESSSDNKNDNKTKIVYAVKISNIDKSLKIKAINKFFNECGNSHCYLKFPAKDGKSEGYGEIHFPKKENAKSFIDKYNGISLCGKNKIIMVLRRKRVPK